MIKGLVDQIGDLRAKLAPDIAKLADLEAALKEQGEGRYIGGRWEATVAEYDQMRLSTKSLRKKLSPQMIRAHSVPCHVVKLDVKARRVAHLRRVA